MYYAHEGSATDNAFTIVNGNPTRKFKAFSTREERNEYQEKVWSESNQTKNVIFCTRAFVKSIFPDFYVSGNEVFASQETYFETLQ